MTTTGEVKRVSDEILGRIVAGAYPAGLRLPSEIDLATTLSCGRSTVREALRHLSTLGVVRSRRGSGAMVLDFRREGTPALLPSYVMAGKFDRPVGVLARELLSVRTQLAEQAVRLAARYADGAGLIEARAILARGPALEDDPVAHGENELELFRALVCGSGIWPAVWLANVFWAPMRELHAGLAAAVGRPPPDWQRQMEKLLDRIEARDDAGAEALVTAWFGRIDARLVRDLELVLGASQGLQAEADPPRADGAKEPPKGARTKAPKKALHPVTKRKAAR